MFRIARVLHNDAKSWRWWLFAPHDLSGTNDTPLTWRPACRGEPVAIDSFLLELNGIGDELQKRRLPLDSAELLVRPLNTNRQATRCYSRLCLHVLLVGQVQERGSVCRRRQLCNCRPRHSVPCLYSHDSEIARRPPSPGIEWCLYPPHQGNMASP